MPTAFEQTIAHLALTSALLGGIAVGWLFADLIEYFFWRKP